MSFQGPLPHGPLLDRPAGLLVGPEQRAVVRGGAAEQVREQADAVERPVLGRQDVRDVEHGGGQVDARHGGAGRPRRNDAGPRRQRRDAVSAFPQAGLESSQRSVRARRGGAVVREKEDERPLGQSQPPGCFQQGADAGVHLLDHLAVGAAHLPGLAGLRNPLADDPERRIVRSLVGEVRRLVGDIEEEGSIGVRPLLDERHRVLVDQVRDVARLLAVGLAVPPVVVSEAVDVREVVDVAGHVAAEDVEAVPERIGLDAVAEVPLAHDAGGVAFRPHALGYGRFLRLEAVVAVPVRVRIDDIGNAGPLLVAAGKQPRAGRRADRPARMEVGEPDPLGRHRVERRGLDPAAVGGQVAVAEVVSHDDDDVGTRPGHRCRPIGGRRVGSRSAGGDRRNTGQRDALRQATVES